MTRLRLVTSLALLLQLALLSAPLQAGPKSASRPLKPEDIKAGLELEVGAKDLLVNDPEKAEQEYRAALRSVKKSLGDNRPESEVIRWESWDKWKGSAGQGVYTLPNGDEISVVGEKAQSSFTLDELRRKEIVLESLELVTSPLKGDTAPITRAFAELLASDQVHVATQSSNHVTVDVSHLFETDALKKLPIDSDVNIAKLVDTIVYIEENWANIYSAISPKRYGTIANDFAIPLIVDHPDLIAELKAMKREDRTYRNVRQLFLRKFSEEAAIKGGLPHHAFKYRSAQYKKLFQLPGMGMKLMPFVPAIEFRIPDVPSGQSIQEVQRGLERNVKLFRNISLKAHQAQAKRQPLSAHASHALHRVRKSPDFGTPRMEHREEISFAMAGNDPADYQRFLDDFDLSEEEFPKFSALKNLEEVRDHSKIAMAEREFLDTQQKVPYSISIEAPGMRGRTIQAKSQGLLYRKLQDELAKLGTNQDVTVRFRMPPSSNVSAPQNNPLVSRMEEALRSFQIANRDVEKTFQGEFTWDHFPAPKVEIKNGILTASAKAGDLQTLGSVLGKAQFLTRLSTTTPSVLSSFPSSRRPAGKPSDFIVEQFMKYASENLNGNLHELPVITELAKDPIFSKLPDAFWFTHETPGLSELEHTQVERARSEFFADIVLASRLQEKARRNPSAASDFPMKKHIEKLHHRLPEFISFYFQKVNGTGLYLRPRGLTGASARNACGLRFGSLSPSGGL